MRGPEADDKEDIVGARFEGGGVTTLFERGRGKSVADAGAGAGRAGAGAGAGVGFFAPSCPAFNRAINDDG